MAPNTKNKTIYAQVHLNGRHMMMVDICIQPGYYAHSSVKDKGHSYKWFTEDHFSRLSMKLEDVVMARVLSAPERDKKKSGKTSKNESPDILNDPELLIQYHFEKRNYRQTILTPSRQRSLTRHVLSGNKGNTPHLSEYSGGGYQSFFLYPEKLKVTVSQIPCDELGLLSLPLVTNDKVEQIGASKSSISKYFVKETSAVTGSTKKKQETLKNINKRVDPQIDSDVLPRATSSVSELTFEEKIEKTADPRTFKGESESFENQLPCVEFDEDIDAKRPSVPIVVKPTCTNNETISQQSVEKEHEVCDTEEKNGSSLRHLNAEKGLKAGLSDKSVQQSDNLGTSIENGNFSLTLSYQGLKAGFDQGNKSLQKSDNLETTTENGNFNSTLSYQGLKAGFDQGNKSLQQSDNLDTSTKNKNLSSKVSLASSLKRQESESESDSADTECTLPSLRSRLAQKTLQKKQKTADEVDNDFESPKTIKRNVEKRKGSDLSSDDRESTACSSKRKRTKTSSDFDPKEYAYSKRKDKTNNVSSTVVASSKKEKGLVRGKTNKRQRKAVIEKSIDTLPEVAEEPGCSPLEPITIEDKPPSVISVSGIEELTAEQTEQLVWELASELREIFEGKKYCRRHEDYKRGGRMKGDLAFQVHFGPFSEDQGQRIIDVLTNMFCYRHSKYFDYVSKVLLPETLVMLYMKVMGASRDEAEHLLLDGTKSVS